MSRDMEFRWAILGTGDVARKFVLDLPHAGGRAQVVASRERENARLFATTLSVPEVAPDYEEAMQADVDAVYVATPPHLHEAHALMAIKAGHAVLIEKPFAASAAAAYRIAEAAQTAGVFCMEAMWTRFQPVAGSVASALADGTLGELRSFDACFMAANIPDATASLFDPARNGGALVHRGIYPLSLARHFLGPVEEMAATARIGETGVDEDCALMLRHSSGALSTIRASLRASGAEGATLSGTRGTLYLDGPIYRPTGAWIAPTRPTPAATGQTVPRRLEAFRESAPGLRLSRAISRLRARRARDALPVAMCGNGYHYQAAAVRDAVRAGRCEEARMPPCQSIELMELMDRARRSWGMPA